MLDLDQPISVRYQGKEIAQKKFERTVSQLYQSIQARGDQSLVFPDVKKNKKALTQICSGQKIVLT